MPVKIGVGFKRIEERFTDAELLPIVERAMEEAVAIGLDAALDRVDTANAGMKHSWPEPTPEFWEHSGAKTQPSEDRVDTGKMRDSLDSRVYISGKGTVRGEVGWIHGTEKYFLFQEYGFTHVISGVYIEGMMALRAAKEATEFVFRDRVEQEIERLYG